MNGTTQSPSLETSSPTPAPRPRLLHWAARLVLIAACAGTVATSELMSDSVFSPEFVGEPVTLTTEAPQTTRDIVVRVSSTEKHSDVVEANVRASLVARWTPADPNEKTRPWIRVSLLEGEESSESRTVQTFPPASDTQEYEEFGSLDTNCELTGPCEWLTHVRFEMQPDGPRGTVRFEWKTMADAAVRGMDEVPAGFNVSISAP
ncbi:hypothetical protein D7V97_02670 [Corallococcus sp. CA053C]|nr:hypothetical protein D7V97_02670 [Corallococcus sp. CA053C]